VIASVGRLADPAFAGRLSADQAFAGRLPAGQASAGHLGSDCLLGSCAAPLASRINKTCWRNERSMHEMTQPVAARYVK
jgi:hypothetical protein